MWSFMQCVRLSFPCTMCVTGYCVTETASCIFKKIFFIVFGIQSNSKSEIQHSRDRQKQAVKKGSPPDETHCFMWNSCCELHVPTLLSRRYTAYDFFMTYTVCECWRQVLDGQNLTFTIIIFCFDPKLAWFMFIFYYPEEEEEYTTKQQNYLWDLKKKEAYSIAIFTA